MNLLDRIPSCSLALGFELGSRHWQDTSQDSQASWSSCCLCSYRRLPDSRGWSLPVRIPVLHPPTASAFWSSDRHLFHARRASSAPAFPLAQQPALPFSSLLLSNPRGHEAANSDDKNSLYKRTYVDNIEKSRRALIFRCERPLNKSNKRTLVDILAEHRRSHFFHA